MWDTARKKELEPVSDKIQNKEKIDIKTPRRTRYLMMLRQAWLEAIYDHASESILGIMRWQGSCIWASSPQKNSFKKSVKMWSILFLRSTDLSCSNCWNVES